MLTKLVTLGIGILLLALQTNLNSKLGALDTTWIELPAQKNYKWNPTMFRAMTFGHSPAAIDWLLLRVLSDPAYAHVTKGEHPAIYYDLDLATDLDPGFFDLYSTGANLLSVIRDDGAGARDILLKADRFRKNELPQTTESFRERYWKNSWYISMLLGYVYLFDLNDLPDAATAFKEAAQQPGAPSYLLNLANRFQKPGGIYEVGVRVLTTMINKERNEESKLKLEKKRASLYLGQYLSQLNQGFRDFLDKNPEYRSAKQVSSEQLSRYWEQFRQETRTPSQDPFGGSVYLDTNGKILSTTPRERVLGLE
jgi:hypothetical protein